MGKGGGANSVTTCFRTDICEVSVARAMCCVYGNILRQYERLKGRKKKKEKTRQIILSAMSCPQLAK